MGSDRNMLSPAASESWRAWLLTGARRQPADRRRIRGAHVGLKRMMVEGMRTGGEHPYTWKEFSDAMVRQAVGDAVGTLPPRDGQLIKLAYFGGCTNEELAAELGITETMVKKRLKRAMEVISRHVQNGTRLGRKAAGAIAAVLAGRWLQDAGPSTGRVGTVVAVAALVAGASQAQPSAPVASPPPAPGFMVSVPADPAGDVVARHSTARPPAGTGPAASGSSPSPGPSSLLPNGTEPALAVPLASLPALTVPALPPAVMPAPLPSPRPVPVSVVSALQAPSSL